MAKQTIVEKTSDNVTKGAMAGVLTELFQDMYANRWQVYRMNFVRGVFFGLGGVVGGTIIVFLFAWILSLFDQVPVIGNFVDAAERSLDATR